MASFLKNACNLKLYIWHFLVLNMKVIQRNMWIHSFTRSWAGILIISRVKWLFIGLPFTTHAEKSVSCWISLIAMYRYLFSISLTEETSFRTCTISLSLRALLPVIFWTINQDSLRAVEPWYLKELVSVHPKKSKMADLINFVSKREIDAKKEEKRKAREQILKKVSVIAML